MKKIFLFCAAVLVALAVNAQTDFSSPYYCAADNAVLSGTATEHAGKFYLDQSTETHYIAWSDCPVEGIDEGGYTNLVTWTVMATRACYISVSLDLGPVIASNKHIFQVKVLDAEENEIAYLAEPGENADANQVKELNGTVLIPAGGTYTIQLTNHRSFCKGTIKNVILTYAGAAPITDFSTPYSCTADDAVLSGTATEHAGKFYLDQSTETHYIAWSDCPVEGIDEGGYTNLVTWTVMATRACYISVSLDLGPVIASNKHIFQVKVLDAEENEIAYLAEPGENADANQVKELNGTVLIPAGGTYTIQLTNHRSFCKGTIKNVILTYAGAAPTVAIHAAWDWDNDIIFALSKDGKSASATKHLAKGDYEFKMLINGDWRANGYWYKVEGPCGKGGINADGGTNMKLIAYMEGDYTFEWFFENDSINITFPTPKLAAGYYLVGIFGGTEEWGVETLTAAKKFATTKEPGELLLNYTLAADDQIKVVEVNEIDEIIKWFPEGSAPNYTVDAAHAGTRDIYFRPAGNSDAQWQEFGGFIWMGKNDETGINNVEAGEKAVKMIENGQLVIIKNGVKFNAQGTIIR